MKRPYLDVRFPERLSFGSSGGPTFSTAVIPVNSGHEHVNKNWVYPLHEYDAAKAVQTIEDMEELLAHFYASQGKYYAFPFLDKLDHKSCAYDDTPASTDQIIATGDGVTTQFQLVKRYTRGGVELVRRIRKPFGAVLVSINGLTIASGWSIDMTTGIITMTPAPGSGDIIRAGYQFCVPVAFASDAFVHSWQDYNAISASVPLREDKAQ